MSVARLWRDSATCAGGNFAVITWFGIFASTFLSSSPTCPATQSVGIAVVSAGRRKPRCRRATIAEAVCPQHRRSQPEATKLMAAAMTQSVAITCAQIATIPKNSASEASVATSSTRVRPMSLTPISGPKIHRVRVLECAFPGRPLGKALVSFVALAMERFDCTPNTRLIVNAVAGRL